MEENNERAIVTLTDEDGKEVEFEIIGQHEMNGEHYVALLPAEEEEKEVVGDVEWEYIILKLAKDGDEEILVFYGDRLRQLTYFSFKKEKQAKEN